MMILCLLFYIAVIVTAILFKEFQMAATSDKIFAAVTAQTTEIDSVIALVNGLEAKVTEALKSENISPESQKALDDSFDVITNNTAKLQAALLANVPVPARPVTP